MIDDIKQEVRHAMAVFSATMCIVYKDRPELVSAELKRLKEKYAHINYEWATDTKNLPSVEDSCASFLLDALTGAEYALREYQLDKTDTSKIN